MLLLKLSATEESLHAIPTAICVADTGKQYVGTFRGTPLKTLHQRILPGRRIFGHLVRCSEISLYCAHKSSCACEDSTDRIGMVGSAIRKGIFFSPSRVLHRAPFCGVYHCILSLGNLQRGGPGPFQAEFSLGARSPWLPQVPVHQLLEVVQRPESTVVVEW
jgi:hypothetical protein